MRRGGAKRVLRKEGEVPAPPASPSLEIPKKTDRRAKNKRRRY
jgi:hypothetical protein